MEREPDGDLQFPTERAPFAGGRSGSDVDDAANLRGRRLGPYRIERLIGRGGMGSVYLARRADQTFEQEVAIKLVAPGFASPSVVRRFRAERQLLAHLAHPNIARLLDGGTTADGLPYLVMEYVDGETIEAYCAAHRLGVADRLRLFLTVCAAVEHAHRNLVVHRDIKPSNILVTADGTVKLLDFGIAKLLGPGGEEAAPTQVAVAPMTLAFASPEQLTAGAITTATDVYALGVLLYRLLTGRHPYPVEGESPPTIAHLICDTEPKPPSQVVAAGTALPETPPVERRRLSNLLRGDLDNIVAMALRKEPARRYGSVTALIDDLRRHLAALPVAAHSDALSYRAAKFLGRHRLGVAAAALIVLALVAVLTLAVRQERHAVRERDRAQREATKAAQMNAFLKSMLVSPDPVRGAGRSVTMAETLGRASARLGSDLAGQPEVEASLRQTLGETYRNLGLAPEAEAEHRKALALFARAPQPAPLEVAAEQLMLAQSLTDQGKWDAAEPEIRRGLALLEAAGDTTAATPQALDQLTVTLQNRGRLDEAIATGRRALALARRLPATGGNALSTAMTRVSALNDLAISLGNHGDVAEAEALHREAVAAARRDLGPRHPQTAEAIANLAGVLDMQDRFAEAQPLYREALGLQEDVLGERHLETIRTMTSYANLLWLMKRYGEAEPLARRAVALAREALGPQHHLTAYAENTLGVVLLDAGHAREAEPYLRTALATRRHDLPAGHWLIASAQSNLGAALCAEGRYGDAERELLAAYAVLLERQGPRHEKTKLTAERLAELYRKMNLPEKALRFTPASS